MIIYKKKILTKEKKPANKIFKTYNNRIKYKMIKKPKIRMYKNLQTMKELNQTI